MVWIMNSRQFIRPKKKLKQLKSCFFVYDLSACLRFVILLIYLNMNNTNIQLPEYEEMMKAGMHFGRKKTVFNPSMKQFVHTSKENIYILDLVKTVGALSVAVDFFKKMKDEGKITLFVGITKQSADIVKDAAKELGMPYMVNRWIGGTLTNFKTINDRIKYMFELEQRLSSPEKMEGYTKKEKLMMEKELQKVTDKFEGIKNMSKLPDLIFVSSLKESQLPIREVHRMGIKTVGIVNTDSDPKQLDYPIPANDNARKSVEIILNVIKNSLK